MSSSTSLGFSEFQSGSNGASASMAAPGPGSAMGQKQESKISKMKQRLKASEAKVSKKVDMDYEDSDMSDAEEQAHLSSFQPPPLPMLQQKKKPNGHKQQMVRGSKSGTGSDSSGDEAVTRENFDQMSSAYAKQYYDQYMPASTSGMNHIQKLLGATPGLVEDNNGGEGGESALMKKLNYMIHLLEDQKDEKVNGITEELVLYCFLGIFIIFVLDSFVKVGKYIR
jgi:hypothetical protein